ncbi:TrbG/VirB9 family P-type conjugative transfer protein [Pseudomonas chlororaphis]|uniref:TrbG/VirB9 family P-type conjugative transfer protein n=1 Tax=Pseudomonas chlororaphis TaxID=587753 RepID=UPI002D78D8E5|nr:TrbG/VirB9 family P-type conjugative transfer protein [Pseudomonas chlororaphis]
MDKKISALLIAMLMAVGTQRAGAESMGDSSPLDRRVLTAVYSPDNVYRVQAVIGRASLIKFPPNETVNGVEGLIISGDPSAWSLGVNKAGSMVAIKPKTDLEPDTNVIINTSKNTYLLELKLVTKVADMTYALRFVLPENAKPKPPAIAAVSDPCHGLRSGPYKVRGDKSLAPLEAWDNGTFTCFRFPTNVPRPVIYQVLPDGTETLANTRTERDILVVHGVSTLFRLRLNSLVLEAKPTQQLGTTYNYKGTTTGEIREVKRAEQ